MVCVHSDVQVVLSGVFTVTYRLIVVVLSGVFTVTYRLC